MTFNNDLHPYRKILLWNFILIGNLFSEIVSHRDGINFWHWIPICNLLSYISSLIGMIFNNDIHPYQDFNLWNWIHIGNLFSEIVSHMDINHWWNFITMGNLFSEILSLSWMYLTFLSLRDGIIFWNFIPIWNFSDIASHQYVINLRNFMPIGNFFSDIFQLSGISSLTFSSLWMKFISYQCIQLWHFIPLGWN